MTENLTLQLTRQIRADRKRAFEASTTPDALMKWFAPGPMQPQTAAVDLREGGKFRLTMAGPSPAPG